MNKQIGFIGCGKMAQAMIQGIISSGIISPSNIIVSAKTEDTLLEVQRKYDIFVTRNSKDVVSFSDILFIAVKPHLYEEIINEIKHEIHENTIVVSIAAGITLEFMASTFSKPVKLVRTMPNTPSLVGEGMTTVCGNSNVTTSELVDVIHIIESFGKAEIVEEELMDAIPAISGSSPAYVYMFIEALADGGVKQGIPREKAYKLAAQAVLGAAKMVLETGEHPGTLKDNVCTPGGATIEAVAALEKNNFRYSLIEAMDKCTEKSRALSK
jgi:pyrroline-5-carboxylate reductase